MEPKEPTSIALLLFVGAALLVAGFFAPTPALVLFALIAGALLLRPRPTPERVWSHHPQL